MLKSILYATEIDINPHIKVKVPLIGEILDNQDRYYRLVSIITSTPSDMMAPLDEAGIDFTQISDWDLFCMLFEDLQNEDISLILPGIDFRQFEFAQNNQNGEIVLWDRKSDIVIDRLIHDEICKALCKILGFEKYVKKPANEEAKKFLIERARVKQRRQLRQQHNKRAELSQLEKLIISLVCAPEFSYNYQSILELSIYQFNMSVQQVTKRADFESFMTACYTGMISIKGMDKEKLTWIMN